MKLSGAGGQFFLQRSAVAGQNPIRGRRARFVGRGVVPARVPVSRSGPSIGQSPLVVVMNPWTHGKACATARLRYQNDGLLAVLGRPALVVVMKPTGFGELDDLLQLGGLHRAAVGRVLLERVVAAPAVVVLEVAGKNTSEVVLVEYDDVVD